MLCALTCYSYFDLLQVREIVAVLDLDVLYYPCPRNGPNFRPKVGQIGGKQQFPYMVGQDSLLLLFLYHFPIGVMCVTKKKSGILVYNYTVQGMHAWIILRNNI